jgi:hypothetical protein
MQKMKCCEMPVWSLYSQHFIFFVTNELAQQDIVLYYSRLEIMGRDKHSSLLDISVSYAKRMKCYAYAPWCVTKLSTTVILAQYK